MKNNNKNKFEFLPVKKIARLFFTVKKIAFFIKKGIKTILIFMPIAIKATLSFIKSTIIAIFSVIDNIFCWLLKYKSILGFIAGMYGAHCTYAAVVLKINQENRSHEQKIQAQNNQQKIADLRKKIKEKTAFKHNMVSALSQYRNPRVTSSHELVFGHLTNNDRLAKQDSDRNNNNKILRDATNNAQEFFGIQDGVKIQNAVHSLQADDLKVKDVAKVDTDGEIQNCLDTVTKIMNDSINNDYKELDKLMR